ncbi:uncharacterized protein LOC144579345 [Callithrix jacchus]
MFASFSRRFRLNPGKGTKPRPRQEHVQYPSPVYLRNPFPGVGASKRAGVKHQRRRGLRRPKRTPRSPPFRGPGRRDSERSATSKSGVFLVARGIEQRLNNLSEPG